MASFLTMNYTKICIYYDYPVSTTMEEYLEYSTCQFIIDFLAWDILDCSLELVF